MLDKLTENKPYHVECGNSLEKLKELPDNSIDSIVTDAPYELGFMGKKWDSSGIAYNVDLWKECLRVLKPGAHVLAFSGSRTYHRMACAIEDAGFEIRDQIMWVYGSGFPKSADVSKAIDKSAGAERDVVGQGVSGATAGMKALGPSGIKGGVYDITAPATDAAKQWQGWGSALKPAHEPICMARKPLIGTIAENVLTHGTGAMNIDGCRVPYVTVGDGNLALNPHLRSHINGGNGGNIIAHEDNRRVVTPDQAGRFPANLIHDGSDDVLDNFPDSLGSGGSLPNVKVTGYGNIIGTGKIEYLGGERTKVDSGTGSAARFFYCAKASKADRNAGLGEGETNTHVTVKPVSLMSYLCRLITPPNGIVLDPFNGSGSTGKGAMLENFRYLGIDLSDEYVKISEARIKYAFENKEKLKADLEKKSKATSEKPDVPKSNTGANTLAHLFSTSKEVTP